MPSATGGPSPSAFTFTGMLDRIRAGGRRALPFVGAAWAVLAVGAASTVGAAPSTPPIRGIPAGLNVVFLLADDLGAHDLGCYGADLHETPNLDRLAREGVRFTAAYAMSVCSPSRAALLTGKHAARLGMTTWREATLNRESDAARQPRPLLPPVTVPDLARSETTLAEVLKPLGYQAFHVGKWHLGDAEHSPETQGFDVNVGGTHWGAPATYFHPFSGSFGTNREFRYVPGLGPGKPGDYLTDRLTDEALRLIDGAGDRPFYLNLWFHDPHTPTDGKPELAERYRRKIEPGMRHRNPDYAAMIRTLDDNVGRVLARLEERGLAERTLVIFQSDNGGYTNHYRGQRVTDNAPLRSGKGSLYEGGIRVPLMIRLPGVVPAGGVCDEPVTCTDLFPTVAELTGAPGGTAIDGVSLVPVLRDPRARLGREALYFHFPHYYTTTTPVGAIRAGDWKLLEYFEDGRTELYRLGSDPGESHDLAAQETERVRELRAKLEAWRREVKAGMPIPTTTR